MNYNDNIFLSDLIIEQGELKAINICEDDDSRIEVLVSGHIFELNEQDSGYLLHTVYRNQVLPEKFQMIADNYRDSIKDDDIDEIADSMEQSISDEECDDMPY